MTYADVINTFQPHVVCGDTLDIGNGQMVSIEFFVMLFGAASSPPTYSELIAIDNGTKGYTQFFDQCKVEGLII